MSDEQSDELGGEDRREKREHRLKKRFLRRKKMQRPPVPNPFGEAGGVPDFQREEEEDPFKKKDEPTP